MTKKHMIMLEKKQMTQLVPIMRLRTLRTRILQSFPQQCAAYAGTNIQESIVGNGDGVGFQVNVSLDHSYVYTLLTVS